MKRNGGLIHTVLLISGIVLAAAGLVGTKAAAAPPYSGDPIPSTVVLRGSTLAAAEPSGVSDGAPVVLRGSPPPATPPADAGYACPSGYDHDPAHGCVPLGYAPYDYGYGPYYGFGGFSSDGFRHRFRHRIAGGDGRGWAHRFGPRTAGGFSRESAHAVLFGRR